MQIAIKYCGGCNCTYQRISTFFTFFSHEICHFFLFLCNPARFVAFQQRTDPFRRLFPCFSLKFSGMLFASILLRKYDVYSFKGGIYLWH